MDEVPAAVAEGARPGEGGGIIRFSVSIITGYKVDREQHSGEKRK